MNSQPTFEKRTAFVSRSVDRQHFRLRPSVKVNEGIEYLLSVLCRRYKLSPHCICAMSNHLHSLLTDPEATLPEFLTDFHSFLAKVVNHIHGERGRLWDGRQTNRPYLDDTESILQETGYTMANPVAAGLVEKGKSWPGVRACWPVRPRVVKRPDFFTDFGEMPKSKKGQRNRKPSVALIDELTLTWEAEGISFPPYAVFRLERPPGFEKQNDKQLAQTLRKVVAEAEEDARDERAKAGKTGYLGREKVLCTPRWSNSKKLHERYQVIPAVKARNQEATKEAHKRLRWWREAYAVAYERWRAGLEAEFPVGTYKHRIYHGVKVAAAAPPGF